MQTIKKIIMQKSDLVIGNEYAYGTIEVTLIAIDSDNVPILTGWKAPYICSKRDAKKYGYANAWVPGCFGWPMDKFLEDFKPLNQDVNK